LTVFRVGGLVRIAPSAPNVHEMSTEFCRLGEWSTVGHGRVVGPRYVGHAGRIGQDRDIRLPRLFMGGIRQFRGAI
jgi:hypothetical protein